MRRWLGFLFLVFCLFWPAAGAWAAERVLLTPPAQVVGGKVQALAASAAVMGLRAKAMREGSVQVIVGLRVPFAPVGALAPAAATQQTAEIAAVSTGFQGRFAAAIARNASSFRAYGSVPFVALEVTLAEFDRLASDPDVISITENIRLRLNLTQSAALVRATEAWDAGYTGKGQTIAIIDSGVEKTHPFFGARVVSEACYSDRQCPGRTSMSTAPGSGAACATSDAAQCDHGTHVAGIAAGYQSRSFSGMAPEASIIAIRVATTDAGEVGIRLSDMNSALERVHELRDSFDIAAVNMSLGFPGTYASSACDRDHLPTAALVNQLTADNIVVVASSGNEARTTGLLFPGCLSNVVSVGAVSDSDWGVCDFNNIPAATTAADKVACYSNTSPALTMLAPGSAIRSSVLGGQYDIMHGTSMAAPHVTGAIALIREKRPQVPVDDIVSALRSTGQPVTDYRRPSITTPRLDVKAALDAFQSTSNSNAMIVSIRGRGSVSMVSEGNQTTCAAPNCLNYFTKGKDVTLTAVPQANSFFAGWSGACTGEGSCTVTMNAAKRVNAAFYAITTGSPTQLNIGVTGGGEGSVTILGNGETMHCSGSCTRSFGKNAMIKLTAVPAYGTALTGWSGACRGKKPICMVRLRSARAVYANFETVPMHALIYNKGGTAGGTVAISTADGLVTCGSDCSNDFPHGTKVRLVAIPEPGKSFTGWQGICKGRKMSCSFTLKAGASVSAAFN